MKILYDYQAFYMQKFGGVSNCFVKLIENLPDGYDYDIALLESDNIHLKESCLNVIFERCKLSEENFILKKKFKGRDFLFRNFTSIFPKQTSLGRNRLCSIESLIKGDFDIFHPTFFHPYFLSYLQGKPFVLTVHDMIPELFFGSNDIQRRYKPILCEKASHIITVSEKTKNDLIEILNVPKEKISVVYHGGPKIKYNPEIPQIIGGRYILYVGERSKSYKCFFPMVKSLTPVLKRHEDICIVCTGNPFTKEEISILKKIGMSDRVLYKQVSDEEMQSLYTHALCFVYPSIYEGFGIPILEAYANNCPVLLNDTSCFPEIARDAAFYFHLDESGSSLEECMEQFLKISAMERLVLLNKQTQRLQYFSWKRSAEKLAGIYDKVLTLS